MQKVLSFFLIISILAGCFCFISAAEEKRFSIYLRLDEVVESTAIVDLCVNDAVGLDIIQFALKMDYDDSIWLVDCERMINKGIFLTDESLSTRPFLMVWVDPYNPLPMGETVIAKLSFSLGEAAHTYGSFGVTLSYDQGGYPTNVHEDDFTNLVDLTESYSFEIPPLYTPEEPAELIECDTNVGDANGDGKVSISDVSLMLKHIAKWSNLSIDLDKADVVNDDKVILSDVSMMLKHIAKWTSVRMGHNDEKDIVIKATCQVTGETNLTCKVCGSTATVYPNKIPCDYRKTVVFEADCGNEGRDSYTCTMCGDSYTTAVPATGNHSYERLRYSEPNCVVSGSAMFQCSVCHDWYIVEYKPTGKHTYSNGRCSACGKLQPGVTEADIIENTQLEVLRLVNVERKKAGLSPLSYYRAGQSAGNVRAKEVDGYFSHTRPNGKDCFTALDEAGVSYLSAGENIAFGYATPAEVVEAWMNSPTHRANILNGNFTHLIVGIYGTVGQHGVCWVQLFLGR